MISISKAERKLCFFVEGMVEVRYNSSETEERKEYFVCKLFERGLGW